VHSDRTSSEKAELLSKYQSGVTISNNEVRFAGLLASHSAPEAASEDKVGIGLGMDDWTLSAAQQSQMRLSRAITFTTSLKKKRDRQSEFLSPRRKSHKQPLLPTISSTTSARTELRVTRVLELESRRPTVTRSSLTAFAWKAISIPQQAQPATGSNAGIRVSGERI